MKRSRWILVWFGAITAGCGGAATGDRVPAHFGEGLPQVRSTPQTSALERAMYERVNRDRAKNGLPALAFDPKLCDVARAHSEDMRKNHFFEHESPTYGLLEARLNRASYLFLKARENLAEAPTVEESEDGLLKSPHHYENLMATDITHVGIGIVKGGVMDPRNLTVTQIFSTPGKTETDGEALASIHRAITGARAEAKVRPISRHPALDRLAQERLAQLTQDPSESSLKEVGIRVATQLAASPIAGVSRVSVGAQVVVDSSQFLADGAVVTAQAKHYGVAVDHGKRPPANGQDVGTAAPRLRVLLLVGW